MQRIADDVKADSATQPADAQQIAQSPDPVCTAGRLPQVSTNAAQSDSKSRIWVCCHPLSVWHLLAEQLHSSNLDPQIKMLNTHLLGTCWSRTSRHITAERVAL